MPTDEAAIAATLDILREHALLVKNMTGRSRADSYVVGLAVALGATVVTGEGGYGNA